MRHFTSPGRKTCVNNKENVNYVHYQNLRAITCLFLIPHCLHQRFEIVLDEIHHDEDFVHVGADDDLPHVDHVFVLGDEQSVDLSEGSDGEAFL